MNTAQKINVILNHWIDILDYNQLDYTVNYSNSSLSIYIGINGRTIRISDHAEKFHALKSDYSVNVLDRSIDDCVNDLQWFLQVKNIIE